MKIVDAVDTIGSVDGEGNTVQTEVAHDASETLRVVWFTRRSQDPIENRIRTHAALFQTILHQREQRGSKLALLRHSSN